METSLFSAAIAWALVFASGPPRGDEDSELRAKAGAVRATAGEMRFTEIPWVTDVFEGFRLAEHEKRPVFLYMITGDPLDDC